MEGPSHTSGTRQAAPHEVAEEYEAWIDWSNERARREQLGPGGSVHVTLVANGMVYEGSEAPRAMDEGFEVAALPRTHLFQMLPHFPDGDFREMPHEVGGDEDIRRYLWSIDSHRPGHDFCAVVMLDLRLDQFVPVRALSTGCPGRAPAESQTDYQTIEFVPRESLPAGFFEPGDSP